MSTVKKQSKNVSLFMALLVIFISCEQYDTYNISSNENQFNGEEIFKSIFFGMGKFSNQTTLLGQISESVNDLDSKQMNEYTSNIETLIEEIKENSPGFLHSFESMITSNNHHSVKIAIEEGSIEIRNNLAKIVPNFESFIAKLKTKISSENLDFKNINDAEKFAQEFKDSEYDILLKQNMVVGPVEPEGACTLFLACAVAVVLYFAVAVHNTAAVAANIYFTFALWGPSLDSHKKDGGRSREIHSRSDINLRGEMLIDEIANYKWLQ